MRKVRIEFELKRISKCSEALLEIDLATTYELKSPKMPPSIERDFFSGSFHNTFNTEL
jgi:hypothetical protein